MTDDTTTDEAPPKEEESEPDPREEATQALLNALLDVFDQNFGDQFEQARFDIVQKEEDEEKERWEFSLQGRGSDNEDSSGEEKGKYEFFLDPLSGGESAQKEKVYAKIRSEEEEGKINLHIKGSGSGKWKKFELVEIADTEEGWEVNKEASPEYGNRKFSQNVLEVWFPQRDDKEEEEETLQIPVHLESDLDEDLSWGTFSDEGLKIPLPDIKIEREGNGKGFQANVGSREGWRHVGLSFLMYWVICNVYAGNGTLRKDDRIPEGFPELEKYRAKRPVNLNPAKVIGELEDEDRDDKLYFPWHVIESACSALNAGKNVIFTGPPGCGKSKLASFLAERATGQDPLMTTASPAWSTGDLIGRYMPDREGHGLVFQEGVFLRALRGTDKRPRWLVIDEFNRADIDACFGELFSVLAGDAVELPFEKEEESEDETAEENAAEKAHPVRIVPEGDDTETEVDYLVPDKFRLIGTMNDADRSGLNDLSFALMRRFSIIHVGSPRKDQVKTIIENEIENTTDDLELEKNAWDVSQKGTTRCRLELIREELERLFTPRGSKDGNEEIEDLISDSVVGVSVIGDVIRFVGEGIRSEAQSDSLNRSDNLEWDGTDDLAEKLTLSYLALATVLQIFPQLEALEMGTQQEQNKLFQAIHHIFEAFHEDHEDELDMLRVKRENENYTLESEETIGDFLFRNLKTRFPRQAETWEDDLDKYLSDGNSNGSGNE